MRTNLVAAAAICLVVSALYFPSLDNPLVWDDSIHIGQAGRQPIGALLSRREGEYRRPLVLLSYSAQVRVGLDSPKAFHGVNLAIHAANAVLVYGLALLLGLAVPAAFAGAALFAAHPLQSAAVAYVSGRSDLLVTLFCLLALLAVLLGGQGRGRRSAPVVAICVAAAALCKENGLVVAPIVVMLWRLQRSRSRSCGYAPAVAAGLAGLCTAPLVMPPALYDAASVGFGSRLVAVGTALGTYSSLLVWPADLHMDRLSSLSQASYTPVLAVVLAVVIAVVVVRLALRPSSAVFAIAAALVAYLPGAGAIPVYPAIADAWVYTPEQFLYLPLAAAAPLMAGATHNWLAARAGSARTAAVLVVLATLVAVVSAPAVRQRQRDFSDEEGLYRQTLAHSPSPRACFNLGVTLIARDAYEEAAAVYQGCTNIAPHDAAIWAQLGYCHAKNGDHNQAELAYRRSLELDPGDALTWSNYAALDANSGEYSGAREKWQKALALAPGLEPARRGLQRLDLIINRPPPPVARPLP